MNLLKSELHRISIRSRSITEFLHYVKAKADKLALIDQPMSLDDLTLFFSNVIGPEYGTIVSPICTRETPLCFLTSSLNKSW